MVSRGESFNYGAEEELVVEEVGAVAKRAGAAAAPSGASGEPAPYRGERAAPARASCSRRAPRSSPMRAAARPMHSLCRCCWPQLHPRLWLGAPSGFGLSAHARSERPGLKAARRTTTVRKAFRRRCTESGAPARNSAPRARRNRTRRRRRPRAQVGCRDRISALRGVSGWRQTDSLETSAVASTTKRFLPARFAA